MTTKKEYDYTKKPFHSLNDNEKKLVASEASAEAENLINSRYRGRGYYAQLLAQRLLQVANDEIAKQQKTQSVDPSFEEYQAFLRARKQAQEQAQQQQNDSQEGLFADPHTGAKDGLFR